MSMRHAVGSGLILVLAIVVPAFAQPPHPRGERLGTVHFQTSCAAATTAEFDHATEPAGTPRPE
jgi:hypothetical protein